MKIDPNETPKLTPEQTQALMIIFQRTLQIGAQNLGMARTCLSCCHFNEAAEACTFYNPAMRPPARVIVEACPAWSGDPF